MCCGGKVAKDPHTVVDSTGAPLPQHTGSDGVVYPVYAWAVCPGGADPRWLLGSDSNWDRAQGLAIIGGCPFDGSRVLLLDTPATGRWIV